MNKIFLLSHDTVQSELLCDVIHRKLNIVTILCSPDEELKSHIKKSHSLLVFDYKSIPKNQYEKIALSIKDIDCISVIINAPKKNSYQELIRWQGIRGVFKEDITIDFLLRGLAEVLNGHNWLPRDILNKIQEEYEREIVTQGKSTISKNNIDKLTCRERQILEVLNISKSNIQLADQLYISENTLKTHLNNIFKKLNVKNRLEAIDWKNANLH